MENTFDTQEHSVEKLSFDSFRSEVLQDYRWVCLSRETSLIGRKEVLTGKAKKVEDVKSVKAEDKTTKKTKTKTSSK